MCKKEKGGKQCWVLGGDGGEMAGRVERPTVEQILSKFGQILETATF